MMTDRKDLAVYDWGDGGSDQMSVDRQVDADEVDEEDAEVGSDQDRMDPGDFLT